MAEGLYDEDGLDGPFARRIAAAIRDDAKAAWCVHCEEEVEAPHHCPQQVRGEAIAAPYEGRTWQPGGPSPTGANHGKRTRCAGEFPSEDE